MKEKIKNILFFIVFNFIFYYLLTLNNVFFKEIKIFLLSISH